VDGPTLKYARIERERRFLLRCLPADLPVTYRRIRDRYLEGTRLRLRRVEAADGTVVALKLGQKFSDAVHGAGLSTTMTNLYLTEPEYELLQRLGGRPIVKRRYAYIDGAQGFSIDAFEAALEGLVLAEVEFDSAAAAGALPVPGFAVAEVTDEPFFTGGRLAGVSAEQLHLELARWGIEADRSAAPRG
jgi:CYTH domain-containing protein